MSPEDKPLNAAPTPVAAENGEEAKTPQRSLLWAIFRWS